MLQPYSNQTDIPEALREHYSKREDGKWHADIPDDHPAVKHNAKLLSEKQTAESKVTQLTSELESARAGNLGRGQVAVTKAEVQLLDEYKALGKTPAELTTAVAEHRTLKEESDKRAREDKLALVAKQLELDAEVFKRLPGLPDFDIRDGKDGKKQVIALVKDGDKTVEKPALEYIEASPDHSPFLTALRTKPAGVTVHGTGGTAPQSQSGDPFAWAREFGKSINEQGKPTTDLLTSFGLSKSA